MERLQKVMAHAGVASRRKSEELILEGRVAVNGQIVRELGVKVTPEDLVEVDGKPINKEEHRYFLFYKPRGVISAASDDKDRKVVTDYFNFVEERIYPIGRLDYDTSGLILLTNDGEFANLLMHPRYEVEKEYVAKIEGLLLPHEVQRLEKGLIIDKRKTAPAKVRIIRENKKDQTSIVQLTIHEGWNHQVKRMFEAVGHPVQKLKRESYSFLTLDGLQVGQARELTAFEVDKLKKIAQSEE